MKHERRIGVMRYYDIVVSDDTHCSVECPSYFKGTCTRFPTIQGGFRPLQGLPPKRFKVCIEAEKKAGQK